MTITGMCMYFCMCANSLDELTDNHSNRDYGGRHSIYYHADHFPHALTTDRATLTTETCIKWWLSSCCLWKSVLRAFVALTTWWKPYKIIICEARLLSKGPNFDFQITQSTELCWQLPLDLKSGTGHLASYGHHSEVELMINQAEVIQLVP